LKHRVLGELETKVRPDCVIASNTSTIPISRIAEAVQNPQRVVGMHFFSPVAKMPLVEVVAHAQTAPWVVATVASFGRAMNKTVLVVKDSPGFWVNRILAPYLREAWLLLEEGVEAEALDLAMTEFGFPVGPVTLLDEIGLDVVLESSEAMYEAFGERLKPLAGVARMVNEGRLGRKSGRGLFRYRRGKKKRIDASAYDLIGVRECPPVPSDDITGRLIFAMLNEAASALEEDVVRSPRDGDLGAIYGAGFPPFRGGPLRYFDQLGLANALATLEGLSESYGDRFTAAPSLVQMAKGNVCFYPPRSTTEL
jgi:3-hydroxyacyl-CoA dehydrogenase/enoyl-CoA hydratase/3-hydroxybutyryl-CoA epimerase